MFLSTKVIHVELSSRCVLKCPRCPRTELNLDYLNQDITYEQFISWFNKDFLIQVDTLLFCGHTGDPIYAIDFLKIIKYIKEHSKCHIKIVTNGSYKKSQWWGELGQMLDTNDQVVFSVDGWNHESNNQYRVNSNFESIVDGITSLRQSSKCYITWSVIYFSFNQYHINNIINLAKQLGCDAVKAVRSSKFGNNYLSEQNTDLLQPEDKFVADTLFYESDFYKLNSTSQCYSSNITSLNKHPWARCANHLKEPFIDVRGLVYPCPWFGETYQDNPFIKENTNRLSAHYRSLDEIFNDDTLWEELSNSFDQHPLPICQLKCKNGQQ